MELWEICAGCMAFKGSKKQCPYCGRKEDALPESPFLLPPRTVLKGRYLVGKGLGRGGFGITYLGLDLQAKVKVAIKEYMPNGMATRNHNQSQLSVYSGEARAQFEYGLEKFIQEANTLLQFREVPGIVAFYSVFAGNNTAYIVMEFLEGMNLRQYVDMKGGRLPLGTVTQILLPVMDALSLVHKSGIIHRDISPENIYLGFDRQVKLLDFGAARQALAEKSSSLTVILKPGYAPFEQYQSKGRQGPWTDVYALAATIYRSMTGEVPPDAPARLDRDTLEPPTRKGAALSSQAEEAIMKGLALSITNRYQTMAEFRQAVTASSNPVR